MKQTGNGLNQTGNGMNQTENRIKQTSNKIFQRENKIIFPILIMIQIWNNAKPVFLLLFKCATANGISNL